MTDAERQRKRRERLKSEGKTNILVMGTNGELDERIGIAFAVKTLAKRKSIPDDILELIIKTSGMIMSHSDLVNQKYVMKKVREYLSEESTDERE